MDVEAGGIAVGEAREFEDAVGGDAGGDVLVGFAELAAVIGVPVLGQFGEDGLVFDLRGGGLFGRGIFPGWSWLRRRDRRRWIWRRSVERRVLLDGGVAARLGDGRVVGFVVAVATVADEVDDDVGVEALAVLGGDARRCGRRCRDLRR